MEETIIPLQLTKELQEELARLKRETFPEKTEEELCWMVVRLGLDSRKNNT